MRDETDLLKILTDTVPFAQWKKPDPAQEAAGNAPEPLAVVTAASLLATPAPPRLWLCEPWVPGDDVTLLSGDGGIGKSTVAAQLHWACATGKPWLGMTVRPCPSVYVSCEDPLREIHYRLEQFHKAEVMTPPNLDKLHILDLSIRDALMSTLDPETRHLVMTTLFRQVENLVLTTGAGLVTFDASADVFAGNEIDRTQVRAFIANLRAPQHPADVRLDPDRTSERGRHEDGPRLFRLDRVE